MAGCYVVPFERLSIRPYVRTYAHPAVSDSFPISNQYFLTHCCCCCFFFFLLFFFFKFCTHIDIGNEWFCIANRLLTTALWPLLVVRFSSIVDGWIFMIKFCLCIYDQVSSP